MWPLMPQLSTTTSRWPRVPCRCVWPTQSCRMSSFASSSSRPAGGSRTAIQDHCRFVISPYGGSTSLCYLLETLMWSRKYRVEKQQGNHPVHRWSKNHDCLRKSRSKLCIFILFVYISSHNWGFIVHITRSGITNRGQALRNVFLFHKCIWRAETPP